MNTINVDCSKTSTRDETGNRDLPWSMPDIRYRTSMEGKRRNDGTADIGGRKSVIREEIVGEHFPESITA